MSEDHEDVPPVPEEPQVQTLQRPPPQPETLIAEVRSTGLVVPESVQAEGLVTKSICGVRSQGAESGIMELRSNESMLIDTLLSSNSMFEAAKKKDDAPGFFGNLMKSIPVSS